MWNLENTINKPIKLKQSHRHRERAGGYQKGGRVRPLGQRGEGTEEHKLVVTYIMHGMSFVITEELVLWASLGCLTLPHNCSGLWHKRKEKNFSPLSER